MMESQDHVLSPDSAGTLETKSVTTTPIMKLPGRKLLVVTTTHITSVVDDPLERTVFPTSDIPRLQQDNETAAAHVLSSDFTPFMPSQVVAERVDKSRNKVKNACAYCHEVRKTCEAVRPCQRCQVAGVECKDRARKKMPWNRGPKVGKNAARRAPRSSVSQTVLNTPGPATASTSALMLNSPGVVDPVYVGGPVETYMGHPIPQDAWNGLHTGPFFAHLGWAPPVEYTVYGAPLQGTAITHETFSGANDPQP
ncbi:hypothetical protein K466DRAFT_662938 [Polyporus arcularius HHB13444]|uniref:Transcription activator of gluconeogenesis ERT1 n=1 Tax=Polyporus arcularius HHB13444 TaxID=1314778 RepID=A0A5C3PG43_9APHY|nr:hypothetical protein K466DRAFT_662938 [Polyporus arcularius HHB13444]